MSEENKDPYVGTIRVTGKGVGYFSLPAEASAKVGLLPNEDFEIPPEQVNTALNRDTVRIEDLRKTSPYGRKLAKVAEVIERHKTEFVGTLDDGFLVPDNKRMYRDIFVEDTKGAKNGDKIQVKITSWEDAAKSPKGELVRVIGRAGEHNAEMLGIVYDSGFEIDFPAEVEKEADEWKKKFDKEDHTKNRRDFSSTTTFTIDPADAKDFDDAISIKTFEGGDYEIGIHIADVSHFVVPGTALDKEARKRGTSIYLVDRTIPMLPEVLSNDLCSLNPNEPKYAFSAVFVMSKEGRVKERWFGRTLIESDKRFTYEEAQETLDEGSGQYYEELKTLNEIAYKLREEKFKKGAIDFETEEVKFELDPAGKPVRVFERALEHRHERFCVFAFCQIGEDAAILRMKSRL